MHVQWVYFLKKVSENLSSNENSAWKPLTNIRFFAVRSLEQLLVSLQWGRQQTYYPSAQPLSNGELAAANHKLADSINSHLLGNTSSNMVKGSSTTTEQLCSTPAEKMAKEVQMFTLVQI